jgi:ankyrin repeat protein
MSENECLKSLAFFEMNDRFNGIDAATDGTCEWLLLHKTYSDWVTCDLGLLWVKGKPGSGKSTLLRSALNDDMIASQIGTDAVLSFFFHGRGVKLQRTPLGLFRSLLSQLLRKLPDKLTDLVDAFHKHEDSVKPGEKWHWRLGELQLLFESSLTKALADQAVWLFIDALDEIGRDNAVKLVDKLNDIRKGLPSILLPFRICFTCRHYPVLDRDIGHDSVFEVCLEDNNEVDIFNFVRTRLSTCDEQVATEITNLITERAQGVFIWARLVVDKVLCLNDRGVELEKIMNFIYSVHPDLYQLYHGLIQGTKEGPASIKLVQWICFARRPLTLDELRCAMVTDPDCSYKTLQECQSAEHYTSDTDMMEERLKDLSCGLAETVPSSHGKVVQFIHQSVKDFFVEQGLWALDGSNKWNVQFLSQLAMDIYKSARGTFCEKRLSALKNKTTLIALATVLVCLDYIARGARSLMPDHAFHLPAVVGVIGVISVFWLHEESIRKTKSDFAVGIAHYRLSRTCIRYLAMEEIGRSTKLGRSNRESGFPLLHYATTSWVVHVCQSQEKGIPQDDLLNYFAWPSKALLELWVQTYHVIVKYSHHCPPKGTTMLHVAARYQLIGPLRVILRRSSGQDIAAIDAKDHTGSTPLHWAVKKGHEAIVQLFLDRGAVFDTKDCFGSTPLLQAVWKGYEAIVQLLLDQGAAIDTKDYSGCTPLFRAIGKKHEAIVQLLLDRGAAINTKDDFGWTPLHRAVENGCKAIVQLLLDQGAAIDAVANFGSTPLHTATENGHEAIVQLLLDRGATLNSKDSFDSTPLHLAAENGHEAIIQLLLDRSAATDSKDSFGSTPIHKAAENGHEAIVELLS